MSMLYAQNSESETLSRRLTLESEQIDYARDLKDRLIEFLKVKSRENFGSPLYWWLQGSYKNHTIIRPVQKDEEFDIDVGLYLLFDAKERGLEASDAKRSLRQMLVEFCEQDSCARLAESKSNCERICYPGSFHIDLPLYFYKEDEDSSYLATNSDGWVHSDPKSLQNWFDGKLSRFTDREKAQLRRCIKYLKAWSCLKMTGLSSIAISTFVANNFISNDSEVNTFVQIGIELAEHILNGRKIYSPINNDDLVALDQTKLNSLIKAISKLKYELESVREHESIGFQYPIWTDIFEHMFPPLVDLVNDVDDVQLPVVTKQPNVNVKIVGSNRVTRIDGNFPRVTVYKKEKLYFRVSNYFDFPSDSVVHWRARNKNKEAYVANDLGHEQLKELLDEIEESTAYRGTHYMECLIERHGVVLGGDIVQVIIRNVKRNV